MTVAVYISGGADVSGLVLMDSLVLKYNTADIAFIDPALNIPLPNVLGFSLRVTDVSHGIDWSGIVVSATLRPATNRASGHDVLSLTATNTNPLVMNSSAFDLSDVASDPYDTLLTEDGVNTLLTEDGTNDIITEGPRNVAYQNLWITYQANLDGTFNTTGQATVYQSGLTPGNAVVITCADFLAASPITTTIAGYTLSWIGVPPVPVYVIDFSDTSILTLRKVLAAGNFNL